MPTGKPRKMSKRMKISLAVVAVLGVAALGAQAMEYRHFGGWHGAAVGHRGGHGMAHVCGGRMAGGIERMTGLVDHFGKFTAEQTKAWDGLKGAITDAEADVRRTCDEIADLDTTVPGRLAMWENTLVAGSYALAKVRPAVEAFYGTLDEGQQAALDDAFTAHRRH